MPSTDLLNAYADVVIRVGVGLSDGDRLLIHSSVAAVDFTRVLVDKAYQAGAVNVDVVWSDDDIDRSRFASGSSAAAETVSSVSRMRLAAFEAGDLMLYVASSDPDALAGLDAERIAGYRRVNSEALEPIQVAQGTLRRPWSVVAAPTEAWAARVFPELRRADAVEKLWDAVFRACRVHDSDPVGAWQRHVNDLSARATYLTGRDYQGLRYEGPGTDLTVGLADNTVWNGGNAGGSFVPNIPTEEVFAAPHLFKGDGTVRATKPLSLFGNLVEEFSFEVNDGRIVKAEAARGQEILDQLLATDEGATRFGEMAMVPMSSAVAAEGLIWNNTLYDENDGCHIAIGRAYPISVREGAGMAIDEQRAAGLNHSSTHVDFVVGSPDLNVFGVLADGAEEAIIIGGEWGFAV